MQEVIVLICRMVWEKPWGLDLGVRCSAHQTLVSGEVAEPLSLTSDARKGCENEKPQSFSWKRPGCSIFFLMLPRICFRLCNFGQITWFTTLSCSFLFCRKGTKSVSLGYCVCHSN